MSVWTTCYSSFDLGEGLRSLIAEQLAPIVRMLADLKEEVRQLREALPPQLVSVAEAANRLGLSESTAWRRVKDGSWPVRRDGKGKRVLVDLSQLRPRTEDELDSLVRKARGA